jgi:hypothetical protein
MGEVECRAGAEEETMNNRQRGMAFQRWICDWFLEKFPTASVHNQVTVANKIPVRDKKTGEMKEVWISKRNDILGCIDVIIIIPNHKPIFIQATLDSGVTKKLQDLVQVPWSFEHCIVQLWQKREDSSVVVKKLKDGELKEVGKIIRRKYYTLGEENGSQARAEN